MTIAQFMRRATFRRRPTHLAIVVLPNEAVAFQAYRLLHHHGISPEHLAIVGEGYSSPERVGLMAPMQIATCKARSFAIVAAGLGSAISLVISLVWDLGVSLAFVVPLAAVLSGVGGAITGALFGFLGEGSTASIYQHHLKQGRYLLMMEGPEKLVRWGQEVLSRYSAPSTR